ncbi:MAG: ankyrin repeat domain-containing protein [Wolbachia sp.]
MNRSYDPSQIFYKFLLSKACFNDQIVDEEDVKKMIIDLVLYDYNGEVIEHILENPDIYPFSINSKSQIGKTLLYSAVGMKSLKLVEILIREGVDVNIADEDGQSPLHVAAKYGYIDIVQALIKAGADINTVNQTGETPFIVAKNINLCRITVNHITRLETVELYVSDQNHKKKNELISTLDKSRDYFQHSRNCEEEAQTIKRINESLYDFLKESDVNKMVNIWEGNENVRNEFDNEKGLKEKYPEYSDILIHKANKVKKEIFLHNQKPLIDWLQAYYRCNFRAMTFSGIRFFLIDTNKIRYSKSTQFA